MMRKFLLKRALKANAEKQAYRGWNELKGVQLLFDIQSNIPRPEIEALKSAIKKEGKWVDVMIYYNKLKPKAGGLPDVYYLDEAMIFRKPSQNIARRLNPDASVLIDWTLGQRSPNDFLAAQSKAQLKIGIDRHLPCFDLTISGQGNMPEKVIEEIIKYLKMINHG